MPGRTIHPPIGTASISVRADASPITAVLDSFSLHDERYSYLEVSSDVNVLATHEHDGLTHPLAWTSTEGPGRVVYDALGHGVESYKSPGRRALLQREALWSLDQLS